MNFDGQSNFCLPFGKWESFENGVCDCYDIVIISIRRLLCYVWEGWRWSKKGICRWQNWRHQFTSRANHALSSDLSHPPLYLKPCQALWALMKYIQPCELDIGCQLLHLNILSTPNNPVRWKLQSSFIHSQMSLES